MKLKMTLAAFAALLACKSFAAVYYISYGGTNGAGTSWASAKTSFASAASLPLAPGDQIWVKTAYYNLSSTFVVPNGVALLGGFPLGTETLLSQRNLDSRPFVQPLYPTNSALTFSAFSISGFDLRTTIDTILVNAAWAQNGGGIYGYAGAYTINNNVFWGCHTQHDSTCHGPDPAASQGGAIYIKQADIVKITNNVFDNCIAQGSTTVNQGAGIYVNSGAVAIANNLFSNNYVLNYWIASVNSAAGIYSGTSTSLKVINNTFCDNSAPANVAVDAKGSLEFRNNVITNSKDAHTGMIPFSVSGPATTVTSNNDYWHNSQNNVGFALAGTDRTTLNPLILCPLYYPWNTAGGLPAPSSPTINTGLTSAAIGTLDLIHNGRILGPSIDRGAYERASQTFNTVNVRFTGLPASFAIPVRPDVHVVITPVGSNTIIYETSIASTETGGPDCTFPVAPGNNYDIYVKCRNSLSKKFPNVRLVSVDYATINCSGLSYGDVDNDDVVSIFDYIALSNNFDSNSDSDTGWWKPRTSPTEVVVNDSDLDYDGTISIFDYIELSNHFDQTGDW